MTLTKSECGALGGRATLAAHGREHFQRAGKLGALAFWKKYTLRPAGTNDFWIVDRETGLALPHTFNGRSIPPREEPNATVSISLHNLPANQGHRLKAPTPKTRGQRTKSPQTMGESQRIHQSKTPLRQKAHKETTR